MAMESVRASLIFLQTAPPSPLLLLCPFFTFLCLPLFLLALPKSGSSYSESPSSPSPLLDESLSELL